MDFFKKARSGAKAAVKELNEVVHQGQQQWDTFQQNRQQQQQQQYQYNNHNNQPGGNSQYNQQHAQQHQPQYQQYQQPSYPPAQNSQYNNPQQLQHQHDQQQHYQAPPGTNYAPPVASPAAAPAPSPQHQAPSVVDTQPRVNHAGHGNQKCQAPESVYLEAVRFYILHPSIQQHHSLEELDLTFCEACYSSQVACHPGLVSSFVPLRVAPPSSNVALLSYGEATCDGGIPRIRAALRQCATQGSSHPLAEYVRWAKTLPPCDGSNKPLSEGMWKAHGCDDVGLCNTCYETTVRGSSWERQFYFAKGLTNGDAELGWLCDFGLKNVVGKELVKEINSTSPNYERWRSVANQWAATPVCPGERVALRETGSSLVYTAQNGLSGIFCRRCYLDNLYGTEFESIAQETHLDEGQLTTFPCNLASEYSKFFMSRALKRTDYAVWVKAAGLIDRVPKCAGLIGVDEADLRQQGQEYHWYKLRKHAGIEICPSCYHICVEIFGLEGLFEPIHRDLVDGLARQCFLTYVSEDANRPLENLHDFSSTLSWRGRVLRDGICYHSLTNGDLSIFEAYAERIAVMPAPCFSNSRACLPANQRRYRGRSARPDDPEDFHFAVCEECFVNCVQGTPLQEMLNGDATAAVNARPEGFVCQSYSNRTRKILRQALEAGNWNMFTTHWKKRDEVRTRYLAAKQREATQMQKILALQAQVDLQGQQIAIGVMQGLNANTNAIISGIGGSVAEAAAPNYGQSYGNPSVGYGYLTHNGARAAMDRQQAVEYASRMPVKDVRVWADSGDTISDSFVIGAIVDEVTREWNEVE